MRSREVVEFVKAKGGLEYAAEVAEGFASRSLAALEKIEDNDAKRSLCLLVDFVMKRQN